MESQPPAIITVIPDDYHAKYVGKTADGRRFFAATPFVPGQCEFLATYFFDVEGNFLEAEIDNLGPRDDLANEMYSEMWAQKIESLGEVEFCRIEVRPFQIERFGVKFGFIPRPPMDEDDHWWVTLEPGNSMAFIPPWDSGDYDT